MSNANADDENEDEEDWRLLGDDWEMSEPIGSCEQCGINLYLDDDPDYCVECLWWMGL